jgi:F0F1-type ATP synthase epsilon subunit
MMRCTITSPVQSTVFEGLSSIRLVTLTGSRELLPGHIAIITGLAEDSVVEMIPADKSPSHLLTVSAGSFFQFEDDDALVLTPAWKNTEHPIV